VIFQQHNYIPNFVQATLNAGLNARKTGAILVVGGDGRFFNDEAIKHIIQVSAANGVSTSSTWLHSFSEVRCVTLF